MISTIGQRPLGIEAAQLIALAAWLQESAGAGKVTLLATGIRSQVIALVAATLRPELFTRVIVREGMPSLRYLLEKPVTYEAAPDLFCLDLYKEFDIEAAQAKMGGSEP